MFSFAKKRGKSARLHVETLEDRKLLTGTVQVPSDIISSSLVSPVFPVTADFDADGDVDVAAISGSSGALVWFENLDGTGEFGKRHFVGIAGTGVYRMLAVDFDVDGDVDIVANNNFGNSPGVYWFENVNGKGNFSPKRLLMNALNYAMDVGDLNGDDVPDLIVATDELVWYPNLGSGNIGEPKLISVGSQFEKSVSVGDIDADGDVDVVAGQQWYANPGIGEEDWHSTLLPVPDRFEIRHIEYYLDDLDDDGDMDVHGVVGFGAGESPVYVGVRIENNDGVFLNLQEEGKAIPWSARMETMSDINSDGMLDRIIADETLNQIEWISDLERHFISKSALLYNRYTLADVNGDGDIDLIGFGNGIGVHYSRDGVISPDPLPMPTTIDGQERRVGCLASGDFDNDGDVDLVAELIVAAVEDFQTAAWYWSEQVNGQLSAFSHVANSGFYNGQCETRFGDINSDGIQETIVSAGASKVWFDLDGNGELVRRYIPTMDDFQIVDFNSDGINDIVSRNRGFAEGVWWLEGIADGDFKPPVLIQSALADYRGHTSQYFVGDMEDDGDIDFVGIDDGFLRVYSNDGNMSFQAITVESVGEAGAFSTASVIDMDLDGDLDIITTSDTRGVLYFQNQGEARFSAPTIVDDRATGLITFADFDGDQYIDMLSPDALYMNWGNGFSRTQFESEIHELISDIDDDGDTEFIAISSLDNGTRIIRLYQDRVIGDSNKDGVFNSADLVTVFQFGEYEDNVAKNSSFDSGDWNQDGEFDSTDLVFALQADSFEFESIGQATGLDRIQLVNAAWSMHIDQRDRVGKPGSQGGKHVFIC